MEGLMDKYNSSPQFCLDTNIVINLACCEYDLKERVDSLIESKDYKSTLKLHYAIKDNKLKAIITPTVLTELFNLKNPIYRTLIAKYLCFNDIYILDIPHATRETFINKVDYLALEYSKTFTQEEIEKICLGTHKDPLSYTHNVFGLRKDELGNKVAINDAKILSEAAIVGLPLITNNTRDFTKKNRRDLIKIMNTKNNIPRSVLPYTNKEVFSFIQNYKSFVATKNKFDTHLITNYSL